MNLEISKYQDIALHNNRLIISSISLSLVTNVGRNDDKELGEEPYKHCFRSNPFPFIHLYYHMYLIERFLE